MLAFYLRVPARILNSSEATCQKLLHPQDEFWREMARPAQGGDAFVVEMADSIEATAFGTDARDTLGASAWNLAHVAAAPGSLMQRSENVPGVAAAKLCQSMLFSTRYWRVAAGNMVAVHYQHVGAPHTWYCVAAKDAAAFEGVMRDSVFADAAAQQRKDGSSEADVMKRMLASIARNPVMLSPEVLLAAGVAVHRTLLQPGEFLVVCPRVYHAGFAHGHSFSETALCAPRMWAEFGADALARSLHLQTPQVRRLIPLSKFTQRRSLHLCCMLHVACAREPFRGPVQHNCYVPITKADRVPPLEQQA